LSVPLQDARTNADSISEKTRTMESVLFIV